MEWTEILKAVLFGIVEGITEWLPVSSTGHMILLDRFVRLNVTPEFWEMFLVVIQLGAILAVVFLYWGRLVPFSFQGGFHTDRKKWGMWMKILVASVPAGLVGILWEDEVNAIFYNYVTVGVMLILFGVLFLLVENFRPAQSPKINDMEGIHFSAAFWIGIFQMIAAVFPGTSRSGATIIGALLIGISRTEAAEFTFFLAVPAMLGGSALKIQKFGLSFTKSELSILLFGMAAAFAVSVAAIRFLMSYIRSHNFKLFGWYRILLGAAVLGYFCLMRP